MSCFSLVFLCSFWSREEMRCWGLLCGPCEACQAFQNLDPDYSKQSMDDMTYIVLCGISKIPGTPIANLFMHLIRRTSRVSDFKEYFAGISAKVCDSLFTLATYQPKPSCVCHVPCLLGLQSFFFWTYVTYVSNVISTRASIDLMCRTFVSVQTSKQMMLAPNIDYIQSISIVYIHSQNKSCKSLTKKGMTSVGARGLSLKSVSVRVKLGSLPHFQTQVYWKSNDTWYLFILSPWRDSSSLPSYLVGPNKSVLVLCSHL